MTIPKGVWMVSCSHDAKVIIRVNLSLAIELKHQPFLLTSIPPVRPLPMIEPAPPWPVVNPLHHRPRPHHKRTIDYYEDGPDDLIVHHVVVHPCQTGTVWSDGWNVLLCGHGKAMLIKVSQ